MGNDVPTWFGTQHHHKTSEVNLRPIFEIGFFANQKARQRVDSKMPDHIEVKLQLGSGLTGVVFKAFDHRLKRQIAVKIIKPEFDADGFAIKHA